MKSPLALDRDDRRALATLCSYLLLGCCAAGSLLVLSVVLALCVRLFVSVAGL